jgi:hypothetical protein
MLHRVGDRRLGDSVEYNAFNRDILLKGAALLSASTRCQLIASPSRSGSVARMSVSAPFRALTMSVTRLEDLVSASQIISKSLSGSTDPFFDGKSRICPYEASTV